MPASSLRRRWYRAFAAVTAAVVLAGLGNFVGTRLLVQTFRQSALRVERETTAAARLQADLLAYALLVSGPVTGDQQRRAAAVEPSIRHDFADAIATENDPKAEELLRGALQAWEAMVQAGGGGDGPVAPVAGAETAAAASGALSLLAQAGTASRSAVRDDLARAASLDRKIMTMLAAIKLLAIVLAVRLVRLLSTQILRPVSKLRKAAENLASGELDHRIEVDRDDELGALARSFNAMADSIASSQRSLTLQANSDSLTGLVNRAAFCARLEAALNVPERRGGDQAVLFVDLDDFKDVNDSLGHLAGDEVLRVVAQRLSEAVRPGDLAARLGGDEFALLLDGLTEPALARTVAERVVAALAEPVDIGGNPVRLGASVGFAVRRSDSTVEGLMHEADVAMYAAKGKGKHRVERFEPALERARAAGGSNGWCEEPSVARPA